jgi:hypothetical protein
MIVNFGYIKKMTKIIWVVWFNVIWFHSYVKLHNSKKILIRSWLVEFEIKMVYDWVVNNWNSQNTSQPQPKDELSFFCLLYILELFDNVTLEWHFIWLVLLSSENLKITKLWILSFWRFIIFLFQLQLESFQKKKGIAYEKDFFNSVSSFIMKANLICVLDIWMVNSHFGNLSHDCSNGDCCFKFEIRNVTWL